MRNILKKLFAPASASLSSKVLGDLPEWNLDDLFPGIDSDFLKNLLERTDSQAKLLNTKYSGKIGNISVRYGSISGLYLQTWRKEFSGMAVRSDWADPHENPAKGTSPNIG